MSLSSGESGCVGKRCGHPEECQSAYAAHWLGAIAARLRLALRLAPVSARTCDREGACILHARLLVEVFRWRGDADLRGHACACHRASMSLTALAATLLLASVSDSQDAGFLRFSV